MTHFSLEVDAFNTVLAQAFLFLLDLCKWEGHTQTQEAHGCPGHLREQPSRRRTWFRVQAPSPPFSKETFGRGGELREPVALPAAVCCGDHVLF